MPDVPPVLVPVPAPPPDDGLLTLDQVKDRLNVSIRYVRGLRQSGALPVVPLGPRFVRVHPDDLERFIAERRMRAARRNPR